MQAARRLARVPAEALAEFSAGVDRAHAGAGALLAAVARPWSIQPSPARRHAAHRQFARSGAERALVWLRRSTFRKRTSLRGRAAGSARRISAGVDRSRAGERRL